jgi:hypothetical protein
VRTRFKRVRKCPGIVVEVEECELWAEKSQCEVWDYQEIGVGVSGVVR